MNPVGYAKTVVEKRPPFILGLGPRAQSHSDMEYLPGSHCHTLPFHVRYDGAHPTHHNLRHQVKHDHKQCTNIQSNTSHSTSILDQACPILA